MDIKRRLVAVLASVSILGAGAMIVPSTAQADTSGYGYLSYNGITKSFSYEFGVPSWVTANTTSRSVAKGACASYLGYRLGLRWWAWGASEIACGYAVDRYWKPYTGFAFCGSIPMNNFWATRVWAC